MNRFFNAVFSIRYLAVIAVTGAFLGATLMLLLGATDVVRAYLIFFGLEEPEGAVEAGQGAMIQLVASVDHFLFASILMIFGLGLYALFYGGSHDRGQHSAEKHEGKPKRPSWNHVKNLGGMDEMLLKVIIMLLSVSFLEFVLRAGMGALSWTVLVTPIAVVALGLSLKWMSVSTSEDEEIEIRRETMKAKQEQFHSSLDELERLAALHQQGVLDDVEFGKMKAQLLHAQT